MNFVDIVHQIWKVFVEWRQTLYWLIGTSGGGAGEVAAVVGGWRPKYYCFESMKRGQRAWHCSSERRDMCLTKRKKEIYLSED